MYTTLLLHFQQVTKNVSEPSPLARAPAASPQTASGLLERAGLALDKRIRPRYALPQRDAAQAALPQAGVPHQAVGVRGRSTLPWFQRRPPTADGARGVG